MLISDGIPCKTKDLNKKNKGCFSTIYTLWITSSFYWCESLNKKEIFTQQSAGISEIFAQSPIVLPVISAKLPRKTLVS